jgi:hypothetical protein
MRKQFFTTLIGLGLGLAAIAQHTTPPPPDSTNKGLPSFPKHKAPAAAATIVTPAVVTPVVDTPIMSKLPPLIAADLHHSSDTSDHHTFFASTTIPDYSLMIKTTPSKLLYSPGGVGDNDGSSGRRKVYIKHNQTDSALDASGKLTAVKNDHMIICNYDGNNHDLIISGKHFEYATPKDTSKALAPAVNNFVYISLVKTDDLFADTNPALKKDLIGNKADLVVAATDMNRSVATPILDKQPKAPMPKGRPPR